MGCTASTLNKKQNCLDLVQILESHFDNEKEKLESMGQKGKSTDSSISPTRESNPNTPKCSSHSSLQLQQAYLGKWKSYKRKNGKVERDACGNKGQGESEVYLVSSWKDCTGYLYFLFVLGNVFVVSKSTIATILFEILTKLKFFVRWKHHFFSLEMFMNISTSKTFYVIGNVHIRT